MFLPKSVYYEKESENYKLGKELLTRYREKGIPCIEIANHNNIEEMRKKSNSEFPNMKQNLIIGIRKTHNFVPNQDKGKGKWNNVKNEHSTEHKISDFLVPYTSSGCIAMCLYCYLVCNYNKCAYLRLFVNREQMLDKIKKVANQSEKDLVLEIGSNSDLILENTITGNLNWTIENFVENQKGFLTFPTKFDMVDPILPLNHKGKIIVRMSVNPKEIVRTVEIGTSPLEKRVQAINKLCDADYPIGILIAPIILVEDWREKYTELVQYLAENLSEKVKKVAFFELIFMTYSYIHRKINEEAFPTLLNLYNPNIMTGRGKGKYTYNREVREEAEIFLRDLMRKYFPNNEIKYIV